MCFAIGVAAMFILGREHLNSEGMRSALVKTPRGKLLTTFMFFGNFAFAFLFSRMIVKRKFVVAACIVLVFATGVFFTGARGTATMAARTVNGLLVDLLQQSADQTLGDRGNGGASRPAVLQTLS